MPSVTVFVFRQRLTSDDAAKILREIPEIFASLARTEDQPLDPIDVSIVEGIPRNVLSPDANAKGFQGLDILMLVVHHHDWLDNNSLRQLLESQFRHRWVARAKIFAIPSDRWLQSSTD